MSLDHRDAEIIQRRFVDGCDAEAFREYMTQLGYDPDDEDPMEGSPISAEEFLRGYGEFKNWLKAGEAGGPLDDVLDRVDGGAA